MLISGLTSLSPLPTAAAESKALRFGGAKALTSSVRLSDDASTATVVLLSQDGATTGGISLDGGGNVRVVPSLAIHDVPSEPSPVDVLTWDSATEQVGRTSASGLGGPAFGIINTPAGTDPTATVATDTLNLTLSGGATNSITGNSGTKTVDFGVHDPVTLAASATSILDLSTQAIGFDQQNANVFLAGPASGGPGPVAYRNIVAADLPASPYDTTYLRLDTTNDPLTGNLSFANDLSLTMPSSIAGSEIGLLGATSDLYLGDLATPANGRFVFSPDTANAGNATGFSATGVGGNYVLSVGVSPSSQIIDTATNESVSMLPASIAYSDAANSHSQVWAPLTATRTATWPDATGTVVLDTTTGVFLPLAGGTMDADSSIVIPSMSPQQATLSSGALTMETPSVGEQHVFSPSQISYSDGLGNGYSVSYPTLTGTFGATWPNATGEIVVNPYPTAMIFNGSLTANDAVTLGNATGDAITVNGSVSFPNATTTGRFTIGSDVELYRAAANTLRTPDALRVDSTLRVDGALTANDTADVTGNLTALSNVTLGDAVGDVVTVNGATAFPNALTTTAFTLGGDVAIYRSAANILRTPDSMTVDASLSVGLSPSDTATINAAATFPNATSTGRFTLGGDVELYRTSPNVLRTPDSLTVDAALDVDNTTLLVSTATDQVRAQNMVYESSNVALGAPTGSNFNSTLTFTTSFVLISSTGSGTLNATPRISNGTTVGQIVVFYNEDAADTITFPDSGNLLLPANVALGPADTLSLIWNGSAWAQTATAAN